MLWFDRPAGTHYVMPSMPFDVLAQGIGRNVARLRARSGLTQAALAKMTGIEKNYVQKIEYGHVAPGLRVLARLASALDTEVWRLCRPPRVAKPRSRRAGRLSRGTRSRS